MRKFIVLLLVLLVGPAWKHGSAGGTAADGFCNIVTGVYTGVGGTSTCNSIHHAACDGTTDDAPAFDNFRTWAIGTWQPAHPGLKIELDLPGQCTFVSSVPITLSGGGTINNAFAMGIKKLRVAGITGNAATASLKSSVTAGFFISGLSFFQDNAHSARFGTVAKGATSIALLACPGAGCAAAVALFNVGDASVITAIDMQGLGFPPNPALWDYITINCVSTTLTCGGGNISFNEPLTYDYKSNWPNYNPGSAFEIDLGGPATIYALRQEWAADVEYQNLTIDAANQQTFCSGRSCTFTNVIVPAGFCVFPTGTKLQKWVNSSINCIVEVDKMIDQYEFVNTFVHRLAEQSVSVKNFIFNNSTSDDVGGIWLNSTIQNNSVVTSLSLGAAGFGASGAMTVSNSQITSLGTFFNPPTPWLDVNLQYTMSGGIISIPGNRHVLSATNNGSGAIRLTMDDATPYTTGLEFFAPSTGCAGSFGGGWIITHINSTQIDLNGSTAFSTTPVANAASGLTWASNVVTVQTSAAHGLANGAAVTIAGVTPSGYNGTFGNVTVVDATHYQYGLQSNPGPETVPGTTVQTCFGNVGTLPAAWAIPGANVVLKSTGSYVGPVFKITDLTFDANFTYVHTSLAGGFPVVPLMTSLLGVTNSAFAILPHPAPKWTSTGATGDSVVIDANNAGAQGLPLGSYSKRTLDASAHNCSPSGSFTGAISGTVLTVSAAPNSGIAVGQNISWSGTTNGATILSLGTGTGGIGTYNITPSQTVGSQAMTFSLPIVPVFGKLTNLNVAVSAAYTGASLNLTLNSPFIQDLTSATEVVWNPLVNAKLTGTCSITPTSASGTGAQAGCSPGLPSPGANTWLLNSQITMQCSANISGSGDPLSATIEIITNQGVVYP